MFDAVMCSLQLPPLSWSCAVGSVKLARSFILIPQLKISLSGALSRVSYHPYSSAMVDASLGVCYDH